MSDTKLGRHRWDDALLNTHCGAGERTVEEQQLLPLLQHFAETGQLPTPEEA